MSITGCGPPPKGILIDEPSNSLQVLITAFWENSKEQGISQLTAYQEQKG